MTSVRLDRTVEALPRAYAGPGGAVAVLRDGEVLVRHAWGWANAERRISFTPRTLFRMCSITKQFTCAVMLAVPAAIACADVGDLETARRHLSVAEASVARRWQGSAWEAALLEARAHLARAEGREEEVPALVAGSTRLFSAAGHAHDAVRSAAFGAREMTPADA